MAVKEFGGDQRLDELRGQIAGAIASKGASVKPALMSGSGKKPKFVLACQPNDVQHYSFHDRVLDITTAVYGQRGYSPHETFRDNGGDLEDSVDAAIDEIDKSKGVLVHLTEKSKPLGSMLATVDCCQRPFLLFWPRDRESYVSSAVEEIENSCRPIARFSYISRDGCLDKIRLELKKYFP